MPFYSVVVYGRTIYSKKIVVTSRKTYKNLSNALERAKEVVDENNSWREPPGWYYYRGEGTTKKSFNYTNDAGVKCCTVAELIKGGKSSNVKGWIIIEMIELEDDSDKEIESDKDNSDNYDNYDYDYKSSSDDDYYGHSKNDVSDNAPIVSDNNIPVLSDNNIPVLSDNNAPIVSDNNVQVESDNNVPVLSDINGPRLALALRGPVDLNNITKNSN